MKQKSLKRPKNGIIVFKMLAQLMLRGAVKKPYISEYTPVSTNKTLSLNLRSIRRLFLVSGCAK